MLRAYFGDGIDEARLRLADLPDGSDLLYDGGLRWPVLATENVFVLPGVPDLFRSKFEALRERFRAAPFFVSTIYTREDEFDIAPRLDRVAADYPDVEIGSYPNFTSDEYRVKLTIESKEAAAVEGVRAALLALLDPAAIVRTE
jgi:molybdopterin-biosynthesis enzyme MoeA-like protein